MCKKNTMEINMEEGEEGKIETSYARFELRPRYIPYIDADLINKFTVVFFFFFFKCKKKKHDEIHLRKITWMDKKKERRLQQLRSNSTVVWNFCNDRTPLRFLD